MIGRLIWRGIVIAAAFCIAIGTGLAVLFALGALWVGDELQAVAPHDPLLHHGGAMAVGAALFTGTVLPALTALPAFAVAIAGELLHLRSWLYYVLGGGGAMTAIPLLAAASLEDNAAALPASEYMTIFATAGFAGGLIYWLLAGRGA